MSWLAALLAGEELYHIVLDDRGPIIFKLLPYSSFLSIQFLLQENPRIAPVVEDEVWQTCVLEHPYNEPLDELHAGTVTTVANLILFLSGLPSLEDKQELLTASRIQVQNDFRLQLQTAICQAFPGYTPDQLERLTLPQLMRRLAQAEMIAGQPFKIEAPKQEAAQAVNFEEEDQHLRDLGFGLNPHDRFGLK